jgi:putative hydrolase of the HAD superfamily
VRAVVFDWGGTLTPWHTIDALEGWIAGVGDPDLARRLHEAELAAWARSRDEHRSTTLAALFEAAGVRSTERMIADFFAWWEPHTFLDPDAPEVMRTLRDRGLRIGVLSNTFWPREEHERIFRRDGVADLIDAAVYTSEIPWTKPSPQAFEAAMAAVGVTDPRRCVYVGDRLYDDIWGAKSVGMRAIHIPHSRIPADQVGHSEGEPDAVATSLAEVAGLVRAWL